MVYVKYGRMIEENTWDPKTIAKKAIIFNRSDIGKLKLYSNETRTHFLAKSYLVYNLMRMKHDVVTEAKINEIGQVDCFDITTQTIYEVETEKSIANTMKNKDKYKQAGVDLIIIQLHRWDGDLNTLDDFVKQYIRPD